MGSYLYQPLPDPANSLRLLHIEPGWPSEPLRTSLVIIPDRRTVPSYDALSYVWGTELSADPVLCQGKPISVTANLASALRTLRPLPAVGDATSHGIHVIGTTDLLHSSNRPWKGFARHRDEVEAIHSRRVGAQAGQMIWVDALCINQSDLQERAEQVKTMRDIYAAAKVVHIWLGTTLQTPDGAPLILPEMNTSKLDARLGRVRLAELGSIPVILSYLAQALRNEVLLRRQGMPFAAEDRGISLVGFPPPDAPEWDLLRAFFRQPWFYRVWIVQEVVMAKEARLLIDGWEFGWESFEKAVKVLDAGDLSSSHSLGMRIAGFQASESWQGLNLLPAQYLCHIRGLSSRSSRLLQLLDDGRERKATNPVDHVFAVLGLASELVELDEEQGRLAELITIDYNKPAGHVLRDVTRFIMLIHSTLSPLYMVELPDEPPRDCPSWVPSWTHPRQSMPLRPEAYNCNLGKEMTIEFGGHDVLRVSGYRLESIVKVSSGLASNYQSSEFSSDNIKWHYPPNEGDIEFVSSAWKIVDEFQPSGTAGNSLIDNDYMSGDGAFEAFVYTLCGNSSSAEVEHTKADSSDEVLKSAYSWFDQFSSCLQRPGSLLGRSWNVLQEIIYPGTGLGFQSSLLGASTSRRFFITLSGFMGIGAKNMQEGDIVVVILGLSLPFILRETGADTGEFIVVGPCYVHGIMDGELVTASEGQPLQTFTLI